MRLLRKAQKLLALGTGFAVTGITGVALPTAGVTLLVGSQTLQAAEVCYEDDRGRIVNRRRPGYLRVECPQPDAEEAADRVEGSTARAAGEERRVDYGLVRSRNKPSLVPLSLIHI